MYEIVVSFEKDVSSGYIEESRLARVSYRALPITAMKDFFTAC